jgi:hypothetical protein
MEISTTAMTPAKRIEILATVVHRYARQSGALAVIDRLITRITVGK